MIGIPLGLVYANVGEWLVHKYVLHGLGRNKKSFWSYHWHEHHREARLHEHIDKFYNRTLFKPVLDAQSKEVLSLVGAALLHAPLFPVAPFFTATVWYSTLYYYRVHKKSHQDPGWAREYLPWHYDHHMGPNQHANWCVSRDWSDRWFGTREPYVGTEREARDIEKRKRLRERKAKRRAEKEAARAS